MCLNFKLIFFRVSSLAYPNLLGKKGYVVVVVTLCTAHQPKSPNARSGRTLPASLNFKETLDLRKSKVYCSALWPTVRNVR